MQFGKEKWWLLTNVMNTNYKTKQCHIQWLFRNNGYYQITFLQKKKKEKKKNPL